MENHIRSHLVLNDAALDRNPPALLRISTRSVSTPRLKVGTLIRARRRQLRMTLQALSDAAGVSVRHLGVIERDQSTPSLGTLAQIARHLDVGMDHFIALPSSHTGLTRAGQRETCAIHGSSIVHERIAADFAGNVLSSFILNVPPGYRSETVSHEGEEILYILEGCITDRLDEEEMVLSAGDSLHCRGSRPHSWSNDTDRSARLLWTGTLPMFRTRMDRVSVPATQAGPREPAPWPRDQTSAKPGRRNT